MKKHFSKFLAFLLCLSLFILTGHVGNAQEDSVVSEQKAKLSYFNDNNSIQYLILNSFLKTGKKTEPLPNKSFNLYLDTIASENLIGSLVTDKNGEAKSFIPVSLKSNWETGGQHNFIAQEKGKEETTELSIIKSRIRIDTATADGVRSILVTAEKYENDSWLPLNEAEMKVGYKRLGGILSAGDEPTYTTDSTGTVSVEVTRDSLPGDAKGNIVLAVKIEDNEFVGNVSAEKQVTWAVPFKPDTNFFNQRTLWTTRFKTPFWLVFIAYSIILTVWGTLIYLIFQLVKIIKLGKVTTT